jgi:hypothetical protein
MAAIAPFLPGMPGDGSRETYHDMSHFDVTSKQNNVL